MILRRLAIALRKQDWVTVVIETLIVVFGVFIGLQVNNWNEARQERIETHSLLERLERDFEQQLALTERSRVLQRDLLAATGRLITGIRAGAFDEASLARDLAIVDTVMTLPGPSVAFQELVATGRMRLVDDASLRDALFAYDSLVVFVGDQHGQINAPINTLAEVLIRAKTLAITGVPSTGFEALGAMEAVDETVLLTDPEIMDALQNAYITQDNAHLILVGLRGRIAGILELLEAERAKGD